MLRLSEMLYKKNNTINKIKPKNPLNKFNNEMKFGFKVRNNGEISTAQSL